MRLAQFIRGNIEDISAEWERFAKTLLPEEEFSSSVLRNSIKDLLEHIANDMEEPQSQQQQSGKSRGKSKSKKIESVSETHAEERIQMGLSSQQLISEFRALRASVINMWRENNDSADERDLYDLTRFNEAIDEALSKAEESYSKKKDQARELFLGILAHDLRNPLHAIRGSAELILRTPEHKDNAELANQIVVSTTRIAHMITDLIELTKIKLGRGMSISPRRTDLRDICERVLDEMKAAFPNRNFRLNADNKLLGEWDGQKLSQVLSNLTGNAVEHGWPESEIILTARGTEEGVELQVHNEGPAIPRKMLPKIFDRFVQEKPGKAGSMGLGLYIAKEIVVAHGGTIEADSSDAEGTTFYARLPRSAAGGRAGSFELN
ncbi:MAG: HAMP domain-containing histidine kinase [Mesorhizobium sp.]|uniref:sensor histidine kinase n=1 Tax=Mesorhizobium sp. TaxID=1871066 RepID=UPI0012003731|nr:HAMP domain-containing sensor histidine kinase [Mesorhizobium sp.]TIQ08749.1 MAG: HAMP domain-containing histidine kinase [Mesorhizobium sp.]TJV92401.1 MAG: HAMP domain-containing histidine kinase [Mesorhizobium sp.]